MFCNKRTLHFPHLHLQNINRANWWVKAAFETAQTCTLIEIRFIETNVHHWLTCVAPCDLLVNSCSSSFSSLFPVRIELSTLRPLVGHLQMQSLRHRLSVAMLCDRDHFLLPSHTLNRYRCIFRGTHCKIWLNYSFWWPKFGSKVASMSSRPCKGEINCLPMLCLREFRFSNLCHITWQARHSFQIPGCSVLDQIIL